MQCLARELTGSPARDQGGRFVSPSHAPRDARFVSAALFVGGGRMVAPARRRRRAHGRSRPHSRQSGRFPRRARWASPLGERWRTPCSEWRDWSTGGDSTIRGKETGDGRRSGARGRGRARGGGGGGSG